MNDSYLDKFLSMNDASIDYKMRKITVIGLGSIGSVLAEILIRAGIRDITLIDMDVVDEANLQNQIYYPHELGLPKAMALSQRLNKLNDQVKITFVSKEINSSNIESIGEPDLILDCTDEFEFRFLLNEYAKQKSICWIHAAAAASSYQVACFIPGGACFECVFSKNTLPKTCHSDGVLSGVTASAASLQAGLAIRMLAKPFAASIMINADNWTGVSTHIELNKNHKCQVCKGEYHLLKKRENRPRKLCRSNTYLYAFEPKEYERIKEKCKLAQDFRDLGPAFLVHTSTVFSDGRILIKASDEEQADKTHEKILG